jgi:redox-sensitive bicupin YhaK (pirin superfamily)
LIMIEHRSSATLGGGDYGWLKALHHFAIGIHGNPIHKPIGNLYVWNDDEIAPGGGFPLHAHANVEIITYVRAGIVTHRDSLGNIGQTREGDVQVMSAGAGIRHEEGNAHQVPTTLFQIWIKPRETGGTPTWGTRRFPKEDRAGHFSVLASGYPQDTDALTIRADARVLGATLRQRQTIRYPMTTLNKAYLVPSHGRVAVNGHEIEARDGVAVCAESAIEIIALEDAELVLVETI